MPSSDLTEAPELPFLTIAIPTFNRALLLKECVCSALAQTYKNFEVVVLDNASTDKTMEMLKGIADGRLRIVRHEINVGPARNCAACVTEARGEFLVIVPDDDRMAPWMLEKCVGMIKKEPHINVVIAVGDIVVGSQNRALAAKSSKVLKTGIWEGTDILQDYLNDGFSVHQCTVLMRTATVRENGGYALYCPSATDVVTWIPLLFTGKAGFINESCGVYTAHEAAQTANFDIGTRYNDIQTIADLVNATAIRQISDPHIRRALELRTKGYSARHAVGLIAILRGRGASIATLSPYIRQWKWDIIGGTPWIGLRNLLPLSRSLALLFLPISVIGFIRRRLIEFRRVPPPSFKS